jgi:PhnB protein
MDKHVSPVPDGYHTVNPLVIPKGASDFILFVEKAFLAEEVNEARTQDNDGLLIHAEVKIGDSVVMIFDSKEDWLPTPAFLQVYVTDAEATLGRTKSEGAPSSLS